MVSAGNSFRRLVYRHRLAGKALISLASRFLPWAVARRLRAFAEQVAFKVRPEYQHETLPPIFHYWAGKYLAPEARRLGIHSPEQFYFDEICDASQTSGAPLRVLSLGAGACSMEVALAKRLREAGVAAHMVCVDFNAELIKKGARLAASESIADAMSFAVHDCNRLPDALLGDVIIVNQFFHHVEELELLCDGLSKALVTEGRLLSSDVIGRSGHLLWPDTEALVQRFWRELPNEKRMDRYYGKAQCVYRPVDHAAYSNEGIRAQEVVGCLADRFEFEVFYTFGGSVMPFVERRIGFNFDPADPADPADQGFIDRVHEADVRALGDLEYPAVNMIASLRHRGRARRNVFVPISPDEHVRLSRSQRDKVRHRVWSSAGLSVIAHCTECATPSEAEAPGERRRPRRA